MIPSHRSREAPRLRPASPSGRGVGPSRVSRRLKAEVCYLAEELALLV